jgi:energy-coupling factor transport system permease protein
MLDNITIGQYFPGNSAVHRLDPRMKIIMTMLYIVILFLPDNLPGLLVAVRLAFLAI